MCLGVGVCAGCHGWSVGGVKWFCEEYPPAAALNRKAEETTASRLNLGYPTKPRMQNTALRYHRICVIKYAEAPNLSIHFLPGLRVEAILCNRLMCCVEIVLSQFGILTGQKNLDILGYILSQIRLPFPSQCLINLHGMH